MLKIEQLTFQFARQASPLFDCLSLDLETAKSLAITGPSGCGKSTLLNIISGQLQADSGEIEIDQRIVSDLSMPELDRFRAESIGMVFQQFRLIECLSVEQNITILSRYLSLEDSKRFEELVVNLELTDCIDTPVSMLSGGQQQRVAIARALMHKPKLVLADEPTGNLDQMTSASISDYLFDMVRDSQLTMIVVTHSSDVAAKADVHLELRDGKLKAPVNK